jgi:hypothetical protein
LFRFRPTRLFLKRDPTQSSKGRLIKKDVDLTARQQFSGFLELPFWRAANLPSVLVTASPAASTAPAK